MINKKTILFILFLCLVISIYGCAKEETKPILPPEGYASWEQYKLECIPDFSTLTQDSEIISFDDFVPIKHWNGGSSKKTEIIHITESPWIISWENEPKEADSWLHIFVIETYAKTLPIYLRGNKAADSDIEVLDKAGYFYLNVEAQNTDWHIYVFVKDK